MKLYLTRKELAADLGRSYRFVSDMIRLGFRLPARLDEAVEWLRKNPPPGRSRRAK